MFVEPLEDALFVENVGLVAGQHADRLFGLIFDQADHACGYAGCDLVVGICMVLDPTLELSRFRTPESANDEPHNGLAAGDDGPTESEDHPAGHIDILKKAYEIQPGQQHPGLLNRHLKQHEGDIQG